MAKKDFEVIKISKKEAALILEPYHYLTGISKGFKSGFNYGCFYGRHLVGAIIFTGFPVPELSKGMLGLEREDQEGLFELSRICLSPDIQATEHNLASWFVSRAIKLLRKETKVRVILSYADEKFHRGVVYAACNFKYYGLTAPKKDFYIKQENGVYVKRSRGRTKNIEGEWRDRTKKHRFAMIFCNTLKIKWVEQKWEPFRV